MMPLQPSCRPGPGVCKSYWGFMQVDFIRDTPDKLYATKKEDSRWINSLVNRGLKDADKIKTRIKPLQDLFDQEYKK